MLEILFPPSQAIICRVRIPVVTCGYPFAVLARLRDQAMCASFDSRAAAIPNQTNDLISSFDLELFYPSHASVTLAYSVAYLGIDRSVIPC